MPWRRTKPDIASRTCTLIQGNVSEYAWHKLHVDKALFLRQPITSNHITLYLGMKWLLATVCSGSL